MIDTSVSVCASKNCEQCDGTGVISLRSKAQKEEKICECVDQDQRDRLIQPALEHFDHNDKPLAEPDPKIKDIINDNICRYNKLHHLDFRSSDKNRSKLQTFKEIVVWTLQRAWGKIIKEVLKESYSSDSDSKGDFTWKPYLEWERNESYEKHYNCVIIDLEDALHKRKNLEDKYFYYEENKEGNLYRFRRKANQDSSERSWVDVCKRFWSDFQNDRLRVINFLTLIKGRPNGLREDCKWQRNRSLVPHYYNERVKELIRNRWKNRKHTFLFTFNDESENLTRYFSNFGMGNTFKIKSEYQKSFEDREL